MSDDPVRLYQVSLAYRLTRNKVGTLKEFLISLVKGQVRYERLWAVKDVSFSVGRGEVFGLIGPNGAGKSTLMKMLARVLPPTQGRVIVAGTVSPMIELGAGFNPELTGLENIVLYGTLLGRKPQEMRERATEIAAWADLEEFLDVPIRSYSTGMLARLGFAVATDVQPDVLLVDEVLAVGDAAFQVKSQRRMMEMIANGAAVVLVSHNMKAVAGLAKRALWLDHGELKAIGPADDVIAAYEATV